MLRGTGEADRRIQTDGGKRSGAQAKRTDESKQMVAKEKLCDRYQVMEFDVDCRDLKYGHLLSMEIAQL